MLIKHSYILPLKLSLFCQILKGNIVKYPRNTGMIVHKIQNVSVFVCCLCKFIHNSNTWIVCPVITAFWHPEHIIQYIPCYTFLLLYIVYTGHMVFDCKVFANWKKCLSFYEKCVRFAPILIKKGFAIINIYILYTFFIIRVCCIIIKISILSMMISTLVAKTVSDVIIE